MIWNIDFLVWECIIISYRSTLKFISILSLLLRELKKGETFASLLNIHGGDIRVVPTHLVYAKVQSRMTRTKIKSHFGVSKQSSNQNTIFIVSLYSVLRFLVFRLSVQNSYDRISSSCYIRFHSSKSRSKRESVNLSFKCLKSFRLRCRARLQQNKIVWNQISIDTRLCLVVSGFTKHLLVTIYVWLNFAIIVMITK